MRIYKEGFIDWVTKEDIITDNLDDIRLTNLILYVNNVEVDRKLEWIIDKKTWTGQTLIVKQFKQFIFIFKYNDKGSLFNSGWYRYELSDIFKIDSDTINKLNILGIEIDYKRFIKLLGNKRLRRLYNSNLQWIY